MKADFLSFAFDGKYQPPSRKQFTNEWVEKLFKETQALVQNQVLGLKWFSAATDMWSSFVMIQYLFFTIHYIDDDWTL